MKKYTQLSQDERYEIYATLKSKSSIATLARELGRSRSTIYRELKRNTGQRGYRAQQAAKFASQRRYRPSSSMTAFAFAYIDYLIGLDWSPEQISGALTQRGWLDVPSHEWIYQDIYQDKSKGGKLHLHLRHQKKYRKRGYKNTDRRGQIIDKISIHCRHQVIDQRQRLGDFEGDTVIGKHHKGALLTLVDRKSLYVHIVHLGPTRASSQTITCALDRLQMSHAYSVTFDNGKEFSEHKRITDAGIETYFADPYKSIQRARNENTNGLIRQYLPKSLSFDGVSNEQIEQIEFALNHRPRKTLGWYTPSEVMAGFYTVALAA